MDAIFWNSEPKASVNLFMRVIGPYKIAHYLRKNNYQAQVIDFINNWSEEELYNATKKFITKDTVVLGISTTFLCQPVYKHPNGNTGRFPFHVLNVLSRIKSEFPKIKIVTGGYMSEKVYGGPNIDATVMSYYGSSEDTFLEYVNFLKGKGKEPIGTLIIPSLTNDPNAKKRMWYTDPRETKWSIETDDFKFSPQDIIMQGEPLPLNVSKGCIFACRFCMEPHIGKKKLDYIRGMDYIRDELIYNYENFGTDQYYILDDTFNDTEIKLKEFKKVTDSLPFKIRYYTYLRADLLHRFPDMPYILKESGLWGAYHGIESLHPYASNLVGKGWSGKNAKDYIPKLFHEIWEGKIPMSLNFIIGLPKETKEDILNTWKWHQDNNLHNIRFSALGLYDIKGNKSNFTINSEFEKNSEKYGFKFSPDIKGYSPEQSGWYNETWREDDAIVFSNELTPKTIAETKVQIWMLGRTKFLGLDDSTILNTLVKDINWKSLETVAKTKFKDYYTRLMAL